MRYLHFEYLFKNAETLLDPELAEKRFVPKLKLTGSQSESKL